MAVLWDRTPFLQLFKPIQDDVDLGLHPNSVISVGVFDHEKPFAVSRSTIELPARNLSGLPPSKSIRGRPPLKVAPDSTGTAINPARLPEPSGNVGRRLTHRRRDKAPRPSTRNLLQKATWECPV